MGKGEHARLQLIVALVVQYHAVVVVVIATRVLVGCNVMTIQESLVSDSF